MTFNQKMIIKHAKEYKTLYKKQLSWFSFMRWLASFTPAGSFNSQDVQLAKNLLGDN